MITAMKERLSAVRGVRLVELPHVRDAGRGDLAVMEFAEALPFKPQRCFWTYAIPGRQVRGEHAHHECSQFLVSLHGACQVSLDDGSIREHIQLDRPKLGLIVPPLTWTVASGHSAGAVLLVLASHAYDPADYIREYNEFLRLVRAPWP